MNLSVRNHIQPYFHRNIIIYKVKIARFSLVEKNSIFSPSKVDEKLIFEAEKSIKDALVA